MKFLYFIIYVNYHVDNQNFFKRAGDIVETEFVINKSLSCIKKTKASTKIKSFMQIKIKHLSRYVIS